MRFLVIKNYWLKPVHYPASQKPAFKHSRLLVKANPRFLYRKAVVVKAFHLVVS